MEIFKVETRSHVHETRKQKAESKSHDAEHSPKKAKLETEDGKSATDVLEEYDEFCKATKEHLTLEQMKEILEANGLDSSGSNLEITRRWLVKLDYIRLDHLFLHVSDSIFTF